MKAPWAQFVTRVIKDVMYLKRVNYKQLSDASCTSNYPPHNP